MSSGTIAGDVAHNRASSPPDPAESDDAEEDALNSEQPPFALSGEDAARKIAFEAEAAAIREGRRRAHAADLAEQFEHAVAAAKEVAREVTATAVIKAAAGVRHEQWDSRAR